MTLTQKINRVLENQEEIKSLQRLQLQYLRIILLKEGQIMALEDDVLAEAQRGTTVGDSIINLVSVLIAREPGIPPEVQQKMQASLEAMRSENDRIAQAVLENTPQEVPTT